MADLDAQVRESQAQVEEAQAKIAELTGRISGIAKFGVFVKLDETGADGMIPIRTLGREYFHYDAESQTLMGSDTGMVLSMGMRVTVRLAEAVPVTGGLMLELLELDGASLPRGPSKARRGGPKRKLVRSKKKAAKAKKKVARRR